MDLHLVNKDKQDKLSYYTKGNSQISGENYSLLGFKDNMAVVVSPHCDSPKMKNQIKIITKLPPSINFSKLLIDDKGDEFINLNGQKLKIVPQNRIPEEIRRHTSIFLKQQNMVKIGVNLKKPLPIRVIRNTTQLNNADTFQLVKRLSADKLTTHKDKPNNIPAFKKIKLIRTKLQKPGFSNQGIPTEASALSTCPVNPRITPVPICNQNTECEQQLDSSCDPECFPSVANRREKLLSEKNIQILNQVKMHALNLSLKKIEKYATENGKSTIEIGIQTEIQTDEFEVKKVFKDEMVQTDSQPNQNFDLFEMLDFESLLDMAVDSPISTDVDLSSVIIKGKSMTPENNSKSVQLGRLQAIGNMGHSISGKQVQDDIIKKQLMFFKDLRECLSHNASGNLPIHEGVINNDVGLVKRHCIALKARKAGVNLENHNGCTPLQLAIIHDAHVDIVKTLLDTDADIKEPDGEGNNILHLGAKFERQKVLEVILFHKSFSDCFECMNSFNFEGLTPLMICCMASWTAGANLFICHNANVNLRDQTSGRTALFHAAEAQNAHIVRILLNHKADPKIKNFFGTSPHDAMYELDDMCDTIKSLIFGKSKKRTIEAEMNPVRTAKAARNLKTFSKLQRIETNDGVPVAPPPRLIRFKIEPQIK